MLHRSLLTNTIGRTGNTVANEYGYKIKTNVMETNSCACKGRVKRWWCRSLVCEESPISGSFIQKVWWWISRKEVKLKLVVEMDETELDNLFWEAFGGEASVFTGESVESVEPKPKSRNKPSKSKGEQSGKTVRSTAKKHSTKSKKV